MSDPFTEDRLQKPSFSDVDAGAETQRDQRVRRPYLLYVILGLHLQHLLTWRNLVKFANMGRKNKQVIEGPQVQASPSQPRHSDVINENPDLSISTGIMDLENPPAACARNYAELDSTAQTGEPTLPMLIGGLSNSSRDLRPKLKGIPLSERLSSKDSLQHEAAYDKDGDIGTSDASVIPSGSTPRTDVTMSDQETLGDSDALDLLSEDESLEYEPEDEGEQRMPNPTVYFSKLRDLEAGVFENSAVKHYRPYLEKRSKGDPLPGNSTSFTSIISLCIISDKRFVLSNSQKTALQICLRLEWHELFHLLECSSLITRVYSSLRRLEEAKYCGRVFSLLTKDPYRDRVVRLVPIDIFNIHLLCQMFESSLSDLLRTLMPNPGHIPKNEPLEDPLLSVEYGIEGPNPFPASTQVPESYQHLLFAQSEALTSHCRGMLDTLSLGDTRDSSSAHI